MAEKEIVRTVPLKYEVPKNFGINLAKSVADIYDENYKTFFKTQQKTFKIGEIYHVPGSAKSRSPKRSNTESNM